MIDQTIAIYTIVDDLLKAIGHQDDQRRLMTDAEVATTAIVAALFFGGNLEKAKCCLHQTRLMPRMLSKGRLCRRLHQIAELMFALFHQLGMVFKDANTKMQYVLASFPVAVCDNIRISRTKIVQGEAFRGYIPSKKRYFYGVRIYVLATVDGIPVEIVFLTGRLHDVNVLHEMPFNLPASSEIFSDSAFTDYTIEDALKNADGIALRPVRKSNSKRADEPWVHYLKNYYRKQIETVFSEITFLFPKHIHAVTIEGFLIKVSFFIYAFALQKAFL